MKKLFVIALGACMIAATSNAQVLKQSGGEKNFQVMFAPLGGSPISIGGIAFRKFNSTGDAAFRVNLFIGMNNSTDIIGQADTGTFAVGGGGRPLREANTSSMTISIRPGYEKHMAGTDRLSPYVGAELMFSMTTMSVDSQLLGTNFNGTTQTDWQIFETESKGRGASTTLGLNLIAGVDYYIAKSLSLGAEFGFGFAMTSHPDIESQRLQNNPNTGVFEIVDNPAQEQGSSMQIGPNVVAQFKLGWLF